MATAEQRTRFRRKVGDNDASAEIFSDAEIDDIFAEAGEKYTDAEIIMAEAVVLGVEALMADSVKLTSYKQGQSSETLSDVFKHLERLYATLAKRRDDLVRANKSAVRLFKRRDVSRRVEFADDAEQ